MFICTRAIVRKPGKSFVNALSQSHGDKPSYEKALLEFEDYTNTLQRMGLQVTVCDADESFPDGNFVEDTYLILDDKIKIELNPGAPSRAGEPMSLAPYLPADLPLHIISKKHTIDGGDILKDGDLIYVGISKRTQAEAIQELTHVVASYNYKVKAIPVPFGLHLKSGMTCMANKHFIIQDVFVETLKKLQAEDSQVQYFVVPQEEHFAANVLPINDKIMIPTGCPITKAYIAKYFPPEKIFEADTQQVRLVDGALTCSNLLF